MTRRRRFFSACVLAVAWAAGCNTFDDDLEARIPDASASGAAGSAGAVGAAGDSGEGGSAGTEGSGGEGGTAGSSAGTGGTGATDAGDGGVLLKPADFCDPVVNVPARAFDNRFLSVDTTGLKDDFSDLSFCGGINRELRETDAFFKVDLDANERYHFHVKASPGQNLAVYLLRMCDSRTCVGSIDECPAGSDEHFSFVAEQAGSYILGIDGIGTGPTTMPITVLATHPRCGNRDALHGGADEHSEVCDDGNTNEGDDCDKCRRAITNNGREAEPNGDRFGANVLRVTDGTELTVQGKLGGPCDTDFFAFTVPKGGTSLKARLVNALAGDCAGIQPSEMRLLNAAGQELKLSPGPCPAFDDADAGGTPVANLAAGEYYITIRTAASGPTYDYLLKVTMDVP